MTGNSKITGAGRELAILIFNDVELLDFCGPFEVFSVAGRDREAPPFQVSTVSEDGRPITARNGLRVIPDHAMGDVGSPDILLVPGGRGTRAVMARQPVIDWVKDRAAGAELVLSVCTGSLVLAAAGLLDGLTATTHWMILDRLRAAAPKTRVVEDVRFVDNGRVITSAGVAAGIDMSLHVIARLLGETAARDTARYIDYPWSP